VLVDNSPHAYGYDLDNGIPIESWFDDENDTELLKLLGFLRNIVDAEDVRPIVRNHFKSHELVKNATLGHPPVTSAPPF
jgi:CTD small phosphatase-like protein 2